MESQRNKIYEIISNQFSVEIVDLKDELGPGDISRWDSLGQLRLMLDIENSFGIQLSVEEVMSINNIGDIIKVLKNYDNNANEDEISIVTSIISENRLPPACFTGPNAIKTLEDCKYKRMAIITGPSKHYDDIKNIINSYSFPKDSYAFFSRDYGEPSTNSISKLYRKVTDYKPDCLIAIGGGSTIDTVKLTWLLYEHPEFDLDKSDDISSLMNIKLRSKANFIAIPTVFGSGAEASSAAAYSKKDSIKKTIILSHEFIPDKVILDPNLSETVKTSTLLSSSFDSLTHSIEGYVSLIKNKMMEPMAISAIKSIIQNVKKIIDQGKNINTLEELSITSYYSGIVQNHCSVGLTHSFAHQLGNHLSHGLACAIFLCPVIEFNAKKTSLYENLIKELGYNSLVDFIADIKGTLKKSDILPDKGIIMSIIKDKDIIIDGAMEDVTYRTNPILAEKDEMEEIFDFTMKELLNE